MNDQTISILHLCICKVLIFVLDLLVLILFGHQVLKSDPLPGSPPNSPPHRLKTVPCYIRLLLRRLYKSAGPHGPYIRFPPAYRHLPFPGSPDIPSPRLSTAPDKHSVRTGCPEYTAAVPDAARAWLITWP